MIRSTALALAIVSPGIAMAQQSADLIVEDPVILETTPVARAAGAYLTIRNTGDRDYVLTGVEAGFPRAMLHETTQGDDGIMRMETQDSFEIPAGGQLILERGSRHIMFMGLQSQLERGTEISATLIFSDEVRIPVTFSVVGPTEMTGETDMGTHD